MSVKNLDVFKFIDAVKAEKFLYDKSSAEYRNADKRQQAWSQISAQFGFSGLNFLLINNQKFR